ncbi:MAG: S8 family serine peptidase, partial [Phycisphaerae bacterium]|nr:S8 family serine peptidase [Phycisphaerae bacterium]
MPTSFPRRGAGCWSVILLALASGAVAAPPADGAAEAPRQAWSNDPAAITPVAHPAHVLVRFQADADEATRAAAHAAAGAIEVFATYRLVPGLVAVRVPEGKVAEAVAVYARMPGVRYAEPDYIHVALGGGSQSTPYGITMVNAPQVWPFARGSGRRVAVLDTGVDFFHPDLPQPVASASFVSGQTAQDGNDHGTHCSGTVLARDNDFGVVGVAPLADLLIGKVLADSGSGATSGIISGVNWAVSNNADVISMSLGGGGFSQAFADACLAAFDAGVAVIAAAGNSNSSTPSYPASYPGVISVAAVDSGANRASFSNFGPTVDISAPGVGVLSTIPTTGSPTVNAAWNNTNRTTIQLVGSPSTSVIGQVVYCGTGGAASDFPPTVVGKIAHIRRGGTVPGGTTNITFNTKATNARNAGAIGVIISDDGRGLGSWTLNISGTFAIPVVGVSQADGNDLLANDGTTGSITFVVVSTAGYASFSGTSMATPHVAGVAALLLSAFPRGAVSPALLEEAMESTATDLGAAGRDDLFGWGLVNANAAYQYLLVNVADCPADIALSSGAPGKDGVVTGADFDLFIQAFFSEQRDAQNRLIADVAVAGTGDAG